jgi:hypothetical protein
MAFSEQARTVKIRRPSSVDFFMSYPWWSVLQAPRTFPIHPAVITEPSERRTKKLRDDEGF